MTDPYWDCPVCGKTRLNNPCEHCGDDELEARQEAPQSA